MHEKLRMIEDALSRIGSDYDPEVGGAQAHAIERLITCHYVGVDHAASVVRAGREHEVRAVVRFIEALPASWDGPSVRAIQTFLGERLAAIVMGAESPVRGTDE